MSLMIKVLDQWQEIERLKPELAAERQTRRSFEDRYTTLVIGLRALMEPHPLPYDNSALMRQLNNNLQNMSDLQAQAYMGLSAHGLGTPSMFGNILGNIWPS